MRDSNPLTWAEAPTSVPSEFCPALWDAGAVHGFAIRQPGVKVVLERAEALAQLGPVHVRFQAELALGDRRLCLAEQVHGKGVAVANRRTEAWFAGADALISDDPTVCLGIYVADCCAVFCFDPEHGALGLAHSGARGTRLGIVPETIQTMSREYGSRPEAIWVVLSPCIRPPNYEEDFAAEIRAQCSGIGVGRVLDAGRCTGSEVQRYYSYRMEKGRTGRMLALLALGSAFY
jgi:copper oxidase (laccase) domain-containing protein